MSETKRLQVAALDARVLEDADTEMVVADVRTHIGEEDARRLAACWNACAGLPVESLERGDLAKALERAIHEVAHNPDGADDVFTLSRVCSRLRALKSNGGGR